MGAGCTDAAADKPDFLNSRAYRTTVLLHTFQATFSQGQSVVVDRLCVDISGGRLGMSSPRNSFPSCLSLQRLEIFVRTTPVQTPERPTRVISSSMELPPRACNATVARRAERLFRKTPERSSAGWHTPSEEIIETLALIAEGSRVASLSRVKGCKEETIRNWLQQAAEHATQVENVLMSEHKIERGQLDALWSYVRHKQEEGEKRSS